jgi:hypothetical protein
VDKFWLALLPLELFVDVSIIVISSVLGWLSGHSSSIITELLGAISQAYSEGLSS